MGGNREYRNDPPPHHRYESRHGAGNMNRTPEHHSSRYSHDLEEQYPLEDYPQSRRVYTTDRSDKNDRRDYNHSGHSKSRHPADVHQDYPRSRDTKQHMTYESPRHSRDNHEDYAWYNDGGVDERSSYRHSSPSYDTPKRRRDEYPDNSTRYSDRNTNYKRERREKSYHDYNDRPSASDYRENKEFYPDNRIKHKQDKSYQHEEESKRSFHDSHHNYDNKSASKHHLRNETYSRERDIHHSSDYQDDDVQGRYRDRHKSRHHREDIERGHSSKSSENYKGVGYKNKKHSDRSNSKDVHQYHPRSDEQQEPYSSRKRNHGEDREEYSVERKRYVDF